MDGVLNGQFSPEMTVSKEKTELEAKERRKWGDKQVLDGEGQGSVDMQAGGEVDDGQRMEAGDGQDGQKGAEHG